MQTSISIWKNLIFNTHRPRTNGFGIGFLRRNRIKQLGPFWMGWSPGKAKRCLHQSQHPRLPWRLLRAETWSVAPQLPIPGAPWGPPTIEYPIETKGYWTESIQLGSLLRKWWYYNYGVKDGKRQISMIHKAGNPEKLMSMYMQSISTSEFIHSSYGILSRGDQVVQFSSSSQPLKKGEIGQGSGMKGKHQLEMTARSEDTSSTSSECKMWNIRCKCLQDPFPINCHGFPWVSRSHGLLEKSRLPNFQTAKVLEGQHRTLSGLNGILRCQHKWWALVAV